MKSSCEGRAREYVLRAVEMQSSFHYMWDTFCRLFQETVDPEVGQRQLLNLREKRPTDLSTHLQDILKYAAQASYAFSPETRPSFIIRATRQEMDILLTRYYPFGKKDIQNKEAAIRYNWMTERARLRRQVPPKNPDVYGTVDYHPLYTYQKLILDGLEALSAIDTASNANKYKPHKYRVAGNQEIEAKIPFTPADVSGIELGLEVDSLSDVDDGWDLCSSYEGSVVNVEEEAEVHALHMKPGEILKRSRFEQKPNRAPGGDRPRSFHARQFCYG